MACGQVLALCPGDSPSTLLSTLSDVRRRVSQSQREYAVDYRCQASRTPLGETVKPAITRKACTGLLDIVNCESASYRRPIRRTSKVKSAVDFCSCMRGSPSPNRDLASSGDMFSCAGANGPFGG